ncbi:MAG: Gfo/Idh/MocA family protein, partial [Dongiaceae bacterium]
MLRGAVIGLGNVAVNGHLPAWLGRTDGRIVAAADTDENRRACLEGPLAGVTWYPDVAAMLGREKLDFVDICTPPAMHAGAVRLALAANLHVLCEKPLATSIADMRSIAHLARERGRALHTVHNWLHAAPLRAISAAIAAGEIGGVRHVHWRTLRTRPAATAVDARNWRIDPLIAGGGILHDHGWHALYCVARWMG